MQFSVMVFGSGCSNTLANYHFVKIFTSYELATDSVVEVNRRTVTLLAQSISFRDGVAEKKTDL